MTPMMLSRWIQTKPEGLALAIATLALVSAAAYTAPLRTLPLVPEKLAAPLVAPQAIGPVLIECVSLGQAPGARGRISVVPRLKGFIVTSDCGSASPGRRHN
jgi:hypothetical protein